MPYPSSITGCFLQNWPERLAALSFRQKAVPLSHGDTVALGAFTPSFRDFLGLKARYELSDAFEVEASTALASFPEGVFPRLGFCSWKDSGGRPLPITDIRHLMAVMTRPDERIAWALKFDALKGKGCLLFLREWVTIKPQFEFRLFMKDRVFIGLAQYFHFLSFSEIERRLDEIRTALLDFCRTFRDVCHMDTVVADVFLEDRDGALKARLVELNPFACSTDPCLYSWEEDDFDGRLRYRKGSRVLSVSMIHEHR